MFQSPKVVCLVVLYPNVLFTTSSREIVEDAGGNWKDKNAEDAAVVSIVFTAAVVAAVSATVVVALFANVAVFAAVVVLFMIAVVVAVSTIVVVVAVVWRCNFQSELFWSSFQLSLLASYVHNVQKCKKKD